MQRRRGPCLKCGTEVEFSPSGRYWEYERMRPHWCEEPAPPDRSLECLCGEHVTESGLSGLRFNLDGSPHGCVTAGGSTALPVKAADAPRAATPSPAHGVATPTPPKDGQRAERPPRFKRRRMLEP